MRMAIASKILVNEHDSLYAIHEYIVINGLSTLTERHHVPHVLVTDPVFTIVSSKPLETHEIYDLIEMAERNGQRFIFISNAHLAKLWQKGKGHLVNTKDSKVDHGSSSDRSFYKVPLDVARNLI